MGKKQPPAGIEEFRIGQRVTVIHPDYRAEWPGEYVVVGVSWEYRDYKSVENISIASDDEIAAGYGATDGWRLGDLHITATS
jgi:hypothetical protein